MKSLKIILFVTFFLTVITLNAQEKKATFGVKAGLNLTDITSDKGNYNNTKTKAGFHAGITLDYAFTPRWYLLTGLEYTSKGVKIELSPADQDVTAAYVQLPVSAGYKFQVSEDMAILVSAGPYFAYGIHGKIKQGSYEQDTFGDITLKRFDSGMNLGVALEWRKLCFSLGGELGFVNVMQKNNNEANTKNSTLSVGYKF
ncbi:MAG: PorT family protein [Prevotella sp.]|jgi:hypothetical protein|nr:PorT family protein [Prevotella sp.]